MNELAEVSDPSICLRISSANARLSSERLRLLVVGEFSRGKSTFINALIGHPVLPSRVNPTTAVITTVSHGDDPVATIEYQSGIKEHLSLPFDGTNKFLDSVVSTANDNAQDISIVKIQFPGMLQNMLAEVVDSPGVNDLDQLREEITYKYLSEADAAVLLLDCQQPLSESERIFLREKVLGSDINRIFFVINKIDEILYSGTVEDIPRITAYVLTRLEQLLGIQNPPVYAISSKSALRSRYRGEIDSSPTSFDDFQTALVRFTEEQATTGRLQIHLERLERLIDEQKDMFQVQIDVLSCQIDEIEQGLAVLESKRVYVQDRMIQIKNRIMKYKARLVEDSECQCAEVVAAMGTSLTRQLENCDSTEELTKFRHQLSSALREAIEKITIYLREQHERLCTELEADFGDILGRKPCVPVTSILSPTVTLDFVSDTPIVTHTASPEQHNWHNFMASAGIGFVAGSLFGPLGIAAAVVGAYFLDDNKQDVTSKYSLANVRQEIMSALRTNLDELDSRAIDAGQKIAECEVEGFTKYVNEHVELQVSSIMRATSLLLDSKGRSREERESVLDDIRLRLRCVETIHSECIQLRSDSNA